MNKIIKYKGFTIKETFGERKIEEVFEEVYEKIYGIEIKVRRRTPEKLATEKHQEKKYNQEYLQCQNNHHSKH
ncbi:hypothetical protein P4493_22140 [Bacillus thuringiensis]|uniref:Group-specific protein n=3 Tax=Bacillus thuringiensis TaxID=1428 RepID=A0AB35PNF0_BACTU|nr:MULTISPECIES: hypothetical protein [Bacillus]AJH08540.1 hypothetical protein AS86_495 [Bacillus thuringiensis HD1002]EAO53366.1 hypothetical protein RBTH_02956 [Bacillus thuringiensis serovar israelensis ATCC 35646]MCU5408418.1 hypothetical protein [Bacillus cereus]AFQ27189.1 hypothetical protein BTF1_15070 [Bacillus thuringiensis HD-789]AND25268.1 hypothetical protein ATN07_17410 [Bacillus thuringiensis serovar israelensis]